MNKAVLTGPLSVLKSCYCHILKRGYVMGALATQARPLSKLAPMIRKELKSGFQAGERHWKKAGRLLNEARKHFTKQGLSKKPGGPTFYEWVDANFQHPWTGEKLSKGTVLDWMRASRKKALGAPSAKSLTAARGDTRPPNHDDYKPKLDWQKQVREVQQKIDPERIAREWEDQKQEAKARAALARKIVDAGYRALAVVVHPDKPGGSKEAMAKLAAARKWLDEQIRRSV